VLNTFGLGADAAQLLGPWGLGLAADTWGLGGGARGGGSGLPARRVRVPPTAPPRAASELRRPARARAAEAAGLCYIDVRRRRRGRVALPTGGTPPVIRPARTTLLMLLGIALILLAIALVPH